MGDQIKNMLVGLLMIAACAFTISLILFLKPSVGNGEAIYRVRFSNINGINVGTRVLFGGRPVGEVTSIREIKEARKEPADDQGRTYFYELTLHLDSSVHLYNTDEISIQTSGLLGEKSVAIIPRPPKAGITPQPITNQILYAESSDPFERAFQELSDLSQSMKGTFDYLNQWLKEHGDLLAGSISSFKETMDEAEKLLSSVNQSDLVTEVHQAIHAFSLSMDKVNSSLQTLQDGHFMSNANEFMEHLKESSISVNSLTKSLVDAKGTLGKLIEEDDMYLRVSGVLSKMNTLMNDINQYGILFHLNKTWQREHLQKVSLMESLNSPSAFKTYFTKEVDEINVAMGRLSKLLERAESSQGKELFLENKQFSKDFAEFLREIDALAESAKLYNEELLQAQGDQ